MSAAVVQGGGLGSNQPAALEHLANVDQIRVDEQRRGRLAFQVAVYVRVMAVNELLMLFLRQTELAVVQTVVRDQIIVVRQFAVGRRQVVLSVHRVRIDVAVAGGRVLAGDHQRCVTLVGR